MGRMGIAGSALIVILSFYWVGYTLNRIPKDIAALQSYRDRENALDFWTELGISVFFWVITVILCIFVLYPFLMLFGSLAKNFVELLRGFMF